MSSFKGFRNRQVVKVLVSAIERSARSLDREVALMEVCGTHTMAIFRHGLHSLLPGNVRLISGPGCPVCVTPTGYLDALLELAARPGVIIATFGDMIKVPGSSSSLERTRAEGADVRTVYSPLDALRLAEANPSRRVVFAAVGFETTAPGVAATCSAALERGVDNFFILCAHKLIPPALRALLEDAEVRVDGFILPGHVSAIIGSEPYSFVADEYGASCVIAGFEPVDILQTVLMLLKQAEEQRSEVEIQYSRCVRPEGNPAAKRVLAELFDVCDTEWRGLGMLPGSGLELNPAVAGRLDAQATFEIHIGAGGDPPGCRCGEVLRGVLRPDECALFGRRCTPATPVGACMVSSEGTCAAFHKYHV